MERIFHIFSLFLMFAHITGDIISITKNAILIVNHTNTTVKINDVPFRESVTYKNALFPIQLNENIYFLQNYNSYEIITNHSNYQFQSGLTNQLIYARTEQKFENITFSLKSRKKVHIVSSFSAIQLDDVKGLLKIQLFLNDRILYTSIFHHTDSYNYNEVIEIPKGNYVLTTIVTSTNGIWCSCPELSNGFILNRFISKWEYNTYLRK